MAFDERDFDLSVRPTDDFFEYVNGGWGKRNPIPADESQWGSFTILHVETEKKLKAIMDELVAGTNDVPNPENARKVRDFYLSGMDTAKLNAQGMAPLAPLTALVDGMKDKSELPQVVGALHRAGAGVWFTPFVDQDEKESTMMALHWYQGGLSLPDRDYYLNEDEKSRTIREKFSGHVRALSALSGMDTAAAARTAATILAIETRLAQASRTRVALRDVHRQYNKMSPAEFAALAPDVAWLRYFEAINIPVPAYLIVGQPEFFEALGRIFADLPLADIKTYCGWHILNEFAGYLGEDFEKLQFDFYGRVFRGASEMKPQWRRVLSVVDALLDEAVGELYVSRYFSSEAKKKITVLVDNLIVAYRARIERLEWMEAATKEKALQKLAQFSRKLGYPDKWKDISALEVDPDFYALNVMRAQAFEFDRRMRKVGKPVDRAEWLMPPQMVNAYYQPPMNEIVFPAAILQPPFFDPKAEDALNYGGIGSVIGHELTHGFDDQGALFNGEGNLENWWTKKDKEQFEARTARLAGQFDQYEPVPGLHINGKLTLGENIADLGGLLIARDALEIALKDAPAASQGSLTVMQKFFGNYAVCERNYQREELVRVRVQTDPHSPSKFRVIGPLSNMEAFYEAFAAKKGDRMWRDPKDRVKIW